MSRYGATTIFVGNLPGDVREREVEDLFYKVGDLSAETLPVSARYLHELD